MERQGRIISYLLSSSGLEGRENHESGPTQETHTKLSQVQKDKSNKGKQEAGKAKAYS